MKKRSLQQILGENVSAIRRKKEMTVEDCAAAIDVKRQHWYRIESGSANITLQRLELIASFLSVSAIDLISPTAKAARRSNR